VRAGRVGIINRSNGAGKGFAIVNFSHVEIISIGNSKSRPKAAYLFVLFYFSLEIVAVQRWFTFCQTFLGFY